jgi:hypothetical protein
LYGCRGVIASKGNVLQEGQIERRAGKTGDRIWNAGTGSFERNIIIPFEIDAGMLLRRIVGLAEKLLFVRVNQTGMSSECTYVVGYPVQWTMIAICFLVQSVPEVGALGLCSDCDGPTLVTASCYFRSMCLRPPSVPVRILSKLTLFMRALSMVTDIHVAPGITNDGHLAIVANGQYLVLILEAALQRSTTTD